MGAIDRRKHDMDVMERVLNHARDGDRYESDRRGEHHYPDTVERADARPSQREREELKERLERRR